MTKEQVRASVKIEGQSDLTINGENISFEDVAETFFQKIWKSANVIKNRRESDSASVKAIIGRALTLKLIDSDKALTILLTGNKEMAQEVAKAFPKVEKSDDPSEDDVAEAIALVISGGGQNVSL